MEQKGFRQTLLYIAFIQVRCCTLRYLRRNQDLVMAYFSYGSEIGHMRAEMLVKVSMPHGELEWTFQCPKLVPRWNHISLYFINELKIHCLSFCGSVAEHRSVEVEGLGFNSSWESRFVLSHACYKKKILLPEQSYLKLSLTWSLTLLWI